jgi:hypothetical protein
MNEDDWRQDESIMHESTNTVSDSREHHNVVSRVAIVGPNGAVVGRTHAVHCQFSICLVSGLAKLSKTSIHKPHDPLFN